MTSAAKLEVVAALQLSDADRCDCVNYQTLESLQLLVQVTLSSPYLTILEGAKIS